jgi:ABC-type branched-subunit amino acid transport system ATPase component
MSAILSSRDVTKLFGGLIAVKLSTWKYLSGRFSVSLAPTARKTTFFNCITGFYVPEKVKSSSKDEAIQGCGPT